MSAEIIDFVEARATRLRATSAPAFVASTASFGQTFDVIPSFSKRQAAKADQSSFLFWTGASGSRYVHSVFGLFECPPIEAANYVLVKRHEGGQRTVLSIGRAAHASASLNLADIRQRSAQLGANEVHVHLLAGGQAESQRIEADLRRSLVLA